MSSDMPTKKESTDDTANSNRTEPEEPVDPTLDVTSEFFDPLKALYSNTIHIPFKNAKIFDNVSIFEATLARKTTSKGSAASNLSTNKPSTSKAQTTENPFQRRFLPHQSRFICGVPLTYFRSFTKQDRNYLKNE